MERTTGQAYDALAGSLAAQGVNLEKVEGSLAPSAETPMHVGIYRSRDRAGAIMHTHAPYSTTLACLGWEIPTVHYMLLALSNEGRVPLAPYATPNTE